MCGIFAFLNNQNRFSNDFINEQFQKGKRRGPEFSKLSTSMIELYIGFHRLAINGLNEESNQPIIYKDMSLICNGEIYNYRELFAHLGTTPTTNSDCEVILHLYEKYGMEQTLQMLDGVYSFVLNDYRFDKTVSNLYVVRDPYGVRPLYQLTPRSGKHKKGSAYLFASEIKVLIDFQKVYTSELMEIEHFPPGSYSLFEMPYCVLPNWNFKKTVRYHSMPFSYYTKLHHNIIDEEQFNMNKIIAGIQYYFEAAVEKRCCTTERPIACLLSGGLDSSLVAALVNEYHIQNDLPTIETYSIGLAGSVDLMHAKIVADHLGTKHTEIVLSESEFLEAIPNVIQAIESYDTTTVRASIGNWLLGKYISENSDAKVIFNGDGADELAGGYLYMRYAENAMEFNNECRRLLTDIHRFDVLRSDKCIASHGLEPRTPFLDRAWVQYYLSLPASIRFHGSGGEAANNDVMEKHLIRNAFSKKWFTNFRGTELLPECILWRRKEAFSDGVSKESRSLYEIIQEYAEKNIDVNIDVENAHFSEYLPPSTKEQYFYRQLFDSYYAGAENVIPYFWMPKYVDATDASARTLKCYSGNNHFLDKAKNKSNGEDNFHKSIDSFLKEYTTDTEDTTNTTDSEDDADAEDIEDTTEAEDTTDSEDDADAEDNEDTTEAEDEKWGNSMSRENIKVEKNDIPLTISEILFSYLGNVFK